ncbi:MAG: TadE/TadG family type IV pilus assembly protein [Rhizobiaceae bacterium]
MFRKLLSRFARDDRGNFALATVMAIVPLLGGLAFAIDFTEMNRQRAAVLNALDAAGIAAGRFISSVEVPDGLSESAKAAYIEAATKQYAQDFFDANLESIIPSTATLNLVMPNTNEGGGKLKLSANLKYDPIFYPVFNRLHTKTANGDPIKIAFSAETEIRLKNTIEVALVLDNSGSMASYGTASEPRMTLLKEAAVFLVEKIAEDGKKILQVDKPVQVSLVPFSASVNIGSDFDTASWMDTMGISPVHHENFDWSTMTEANDPNRWIQKTGDTYYKRGSGWNYTDADGNPVVADGEPATRFSLYQDMKTVVSREWVVTGRERVCKRYRRNGTCRRWKWVNTGEWVESTGRFASWQGCVEARPHPYNTNDATATSSNPETLYVPMFAPDEPGNFWRDIDGDGTNDRVSASWGYPNNYWVDSNDGLTVKKRQQDMRKYFMVKPMNASNSGQGDGPNHGCTTEPITPLEDVTKQAGLDKIRDAINAMSPTGYTDVPQGLVWGWRSISSKAPFTEGRNENLNGNDKVIIVLTDGANTYRDLSDDSSLADNQSYYAAHGYTGMGYDGSSITRLFKGTSGDVGKYNYSSGNYTKAHDEHMDSVCGNAKDASVMIFTVALDLPESSNAAKAMEKCASDSRFRKDENGDPKKLYYNTKGDDLLNVFKEIADELSNLRIVG